ncbi:hypothetical protein [Nocardia sp. NPDC060249]|uniref:hypothetical protein n=1 Tax=Nocardia sp. NPDC060249 TaxID=3347082 RepID=UPI00365A671D
MAAAKKINPAAKSRWATMRDEARANHKARPPYLFDAVDPPIEISAPDTIERVTAMAELIDGKGEFEAKALRRLVAAICGDAFDKVWAIVEDEPFELLFALVGDMSDHFNAVPGAEAGDLPGGV